MDNKSQIEDAIFAAIESEKKLEVSWDCGGDQASISFFVDKKQLDYKNPFAEELEIYLMNYLNLPDIGGFEMEGKGEFIIEDDEIYIVYESIMKGIEDPETGKWKEVNEIEDWFSGKRKLFT